MGIQRNFSLDFAQLNHDDDLFETCLSTVALQHGVQTRPLEAAHWSNGEDETRTSAVSESIAEGAVAHP